MSEGEAIDIASPILEICKRFGLNPRYVRRVEVRHDDAEVEVFKGRDGFCLGDKYADPETGEIATEVLSFEVRTY